MIRTSEYMAQVRNVLFFMLNTRGQHVLSLAFLAQTHVEVAEGSTTNRIWWRLDGKNGSRDYSLLLLCDDGLEFELITGKKLWLQ